MIKRVISWVVLAANVAYGLWAIFTLLGAIFVMGSNDTALGVVGVLAFGLSPILASAFALRNRRLAAVCFAISASLWVIGYIDSERYLSREFGAQDPFLLQLTSLLRTAGVHLGFCLFYAMTDFLKWPLLSNMAR